MKREAMLKQGTASYVFLSMSQWGDKSARFRMVVSTTDPHRGSCVWGGAGSKLRTHTCACMELTFVEVRAQWKSIGDSYLQLITFLTKPLQTCRLQKRQKPR